MKTWSRKYDKCRWCGTTDKKHKGLGLCTACFDRRRARSPKRKAQLKANGRRYYDKHKGTDEYKEYNRLRGIEWRKSQVYQEYLKKQYVKWRIDRYLRTGFKTHKKLLDNCFTVVVNGKHEKTPIKLKDKYEKFTSLDSFALEYFKSRKITTE